MVFDLILFINQIFVQNSLITDQFTADPTARVFGVQFYVYPLHDILAIPGKDREGWFCMEDYHIFSFENTLEEPTKVLLKTESVKLSDNSPIRSFLGNSLTVIRISTSEGKK